MSFYLKKKQKHFDTILVVEQIFWTILNNLYNTNTHKKVLRVLSHQVNNRIASLLLNVTEDLLNCVEEHLAVNEV